MFISSHLFHKSGGEDEWEFYPGTGEEMGDLDKNILNVPLAPLWTKKKPKSPSTLSSKSSSSSNLSTDNTSPTLASYPHSDDNTSTKSIPSPSPSPPHDTVVKEQTNSNGSQRALLLTTYTTEAIGASCTALSILVDLYIFRPPSNPTAQAKSLVITKALPRKLR